MKGYTTTRTAATGEGLTLKRVHRILADAEAISPLAKKLGKNRVTVTGVLKGRVTSAAILAACYAEAEAILRNRESAKEGN